MTPQAELAFWEAVAAEAGTAVRHNCAAEREAWPQLPAETV